MSETTEALVARAQQQRDGSGQIWDLLAGDILVLAARLTETERRNTELAGALDALCDAADPFIPEQRYADEQGDELERRVIEGRDALAAQNTETCKACGGAGKLPDKIGLKIGRKTQTNFSRCIDCGGSGVAAQNTEGAE